MRLQKKGAMPLALTSKGRGCNKILHGITVTL